MKDGLNAKNRRPKNPGLNEYSCRTHVGGERDKSGKL
jgi:hypothetical protein